MQSTGRRGFWIPPEDALETAPPGSTAVNRPPQEPPTPTRATTTNHRPPLPLPVSARTPQRPPPRPVPQSAPAYTTSQPSSSRHNGRTGQEYNRRQRRFEGIFDAWSQEMARLEEEHRKVTQSCVTEDESKRAMDDFNRKAQSVFTRYNEEIESLQMSSSEPGSSQSEAEDDEDEVPARTPSRTRGFQFINHDADDDDGGDEDEEEEEDSNEDAEGDSDNDGPSPSEHDDDNDDDSEEDEEEDVKNKGLSSDPIIHGTGSGDETDHSGRLSHVSVKSFQSTQTNGSLGLNTPPPTEVDEDYRATRRRLAREARKADELAAALPQRLRSSTIRGDSPSQPTPVATRPAAMALFETLSSSPASISSVQPSSSPFTSRHAPRDSSASRPSPSIEDNSSRIEILRRNSSLSGSDRSLSRPRPSSNDETQILRDQYEGWKSNIRDHSDAVFRNAEKQLEESKVRFQKEQQEKHARAQALFVAQQEKLYHQLSRNRAGSAGSAALNIAPGSSHPRSGSFAMPGQGHGLPSSASPTLQRGVHPSSPVPPSISPNHPLQSKQSQTFQMAATTSSHAPLHRSQSRTWLPAGASPSVKQTTDFGNRHSGGSSDTDEAENAVEDDESDAPIQFAQHKGSLPISIPNSTAGHIRTSSQIHTGATTMSGTPRGTLPQQQQQQQHLRNSSSTTFSSGTQSTRSSGGWSGASGASSNTTVTSSDTPGSRRGSMGEKTFIPPTGLHNDLRKNSLTTAIPGSSPPTQQPRWASTSKITSEGSTSTTHSPASTLSRASTLAHPSSSGVGPINIAPSRPSVQQWHAMATAATASGSSPSTSSTTPNSGTAIPAVGSIPRSTPAGPLGVGQSPNKSAWKSSDQTSPPIPIQTKPSGPGRGRSDSSAAGVSPPVAFGTTPRPSPPLKTSMSSSDIFSTVTDAPNLKSTPSISSFPKPPVPEFPPMGSRSASPSKLSFIPPKSSPAPAKVTSAQSKSYHPEAQQPSPESETAPSRRETKSKSEGRRRPKDKGKEREEEARKREQEEEERRSLEKEAEEQRKREDDERKREEEEKERQRREEEEKEQIRREEEEKERARKEQEERELKRREAEERERKRREAEERERKRREAEERERKRREAEERERKRREAEERERKQREAEERERKQREAEERERKRREEEEKERKRRDDLARRQEEERRRREEDEEREKRMEELRRREEDLKRREEEIQRLNLEADLRMREEQLRRREEEVKRKEEEVARRVAEVAELNRQKEQEEQEIKQMESHVNEDITPEVTQRATRRKGEGQRKRGGKKSVDEHVDYAAIERERQIEEELRVAAAQEEAKRKEAAKREALRREEERRMREEREEAERREREEQERREMEEQERQEREEEERWAREEAERLEREGQERLAWEEQERLAREERERRAKEEQERKEKREQERKLVEEQARRENEILQELRAQEALRRRQAQQRQEEENRQARAKLEEERRYRQYTASRNEEERERRQEEERRAAEARIREENDRMTERFQARDRTNQMTSNMPRRFADAWEAYDEKWKRLMSQAQTGTRTALSFSTVPWPVLNPPAGPEAITRNTVGAFILSQWHSSGKNKRDRIREALLRWHPDRFESRFLGWVPEGDERDHVRQGVGNVTRSLNELLARESSSGAL